MAKFSRKRTSKPASPPGKDNAYDGFAMRTAWTRVDTRNVLIIVGVAVALRTAFFLLSAHNNPVLFNPIMDGRYHLEWAQRILSGDFWGNEVFFRAPLYPYSLALLLKISGSSIGFVIVVQHLIGVTSVILTYVLARQFFRPPIALLSGIVGALYWPFVYFEGDLLIVTLIVCLDLTALLLLIRSTAPRARWLPLVAGAIAGLSAIARPNILVLFPVVAVAYYLQARGQTGAGRWRTRTALVFIGGAIVISPVLVRNYVMGHDFVPIASQGGVNFYIGNNPQSDGRTAIVPGTRWDWWGGYEDAIAMAERDAGRKLKPSEVSNHYFSKGLKFIVTSPGQSLPLLARKFYLFWAGGERSNNKYIYFFWRLSGLGTVPLPGFWLVAPLGLLGGVLLWRRRSELALLYLFVIAYMFGVVAFFVNARFRLPIVPILIIFGSYAALYLWHGLRRRRPDVWKAVIVLLVCEMAVNLDFVTFRENTRYADSISQYTLGNAYLNMGDPQHAIAAYEEARLAHQRYPTAGYRLVSRNVDYNLGRLYATRGQCDRAVPLLRNVGGSDNYSWLAKELLAGCLVSLGRFEEAILQYDEILRAFPQHDEARTELIRAVVAQARAFEAAGDKASGVRLLRGAQSRFPADSVIATELRRLETP